MHLAELEQHHYLILVHAYPLVGLHWILVVLAPYYCSCFPDSTTPVSSQTLGVLCMHPSFPNTHHPDSLLLTAWSHVWQGDLPGMQSAIGQTVLAVLFGELEELFCNGCHSICNRVKLLYILASCHASSRPLPSIVLPKHCKAQCGMHQGITPTCFVLWI
jgi:hypothetical protein